MRKWNYIFDVPDGKKVRMIVCTDAKNEADDQFAIAHHLMTPKFIVKGMVAGHFNFFPREYGDGHTARASLEEVKKIMRLMDVEGMCPAVCGAEYPMADEQTPQDSEGARLIIEEAMRDDPHPLFIACQGCLTDLASALLIEPKIADRLTAIWIGGGSYPEGGREFNCMQDIAAANVVMKSTAAVWQIPITVYKQMAVTLAELQYHVAPCGEIGKYLVDQMIAFNNAAADFPTWPHGEIWGLGDSPTVGVLLEEAEKDDIYEMRPAPCIRYEDLTYDFSQKNRDIRVYHTVNARLTLNDFFAKININYGGK